MTRTVAVVDHRFADLGVERALLAPHGLGVVDSAGLDRDAVLDACAEVDAVLVGARFRMNAAAIARLGRCRVIVRHGVGVENVDVDAAARAGIWVAYVPDYCIDEVADHAIAMLLALSRRLPNLDRDVRAGAWGIPAGLPVRRLSTQTLGVVGFGRIGEAVGRRARALGLRVLAADPVRDAQEVRAAGAEPVTLDALLERSDLVTLHAPPAHGGPVLSAAAIARMKPGAAVVNVARGGLIDERAMVAALRDGRLAGAALDVAAAEPLRPDDPLLAAPNVLVTPHAAWYSLEAVQELREKAVAEVVRVLSGEPPLNPANSPVSEVAA
jgi:D-3-phosphoglycerate dehydrogenase / 2-oxoglutarate reductase